MTEERQRKGGEAEVLAAFPELNDIADTRLRDQVVAVWVDVLAESAWYHLRDAPKNPGKVPPERKLVEHTRSVSRQALAVAEIVRELHGIEYDRDVLIASAILHDVSKLVEYQPQSTGYSYSRLGHLSQHGAYGAHKAWQHGLPIEVVHSILVHTKHSRDLPRTWEAILVHYVDYIDTDALLLDAGQPISLQK